MNQFCLCLAIMCIAVLNAVSFGAEWKFDLARGEKSGYIHVSPETAYNAKQGYGFLSDKIFAVDVPEGNYAVTIRFGDPSKPASTTIKAESRRLMVQKIDTAAGQYETRSFTVNVRRPAIVGDGHVLLKNHETLVADWDDHLTLEINGSAPGVASIEIKPVADGLQVFIAGDSTVTDQYHEPWAGWGQMLPRFFDSSVAVSNQAWSGLTLTSFEHQKRLAKILSMMHKGDYVLVQFGHNDQKDKSPGAGPYTTYKSNLKHYVEVIRAKGGIPVLVTPMERRRWKGDTPEPTLASYADAVRQVGVEDKVPVIDLNAMSLKLYTALGPEGSKKAFVFYPAHMFPGQNKSLEDNTHHSNYGAYELAKCVVEGIRSNVPELATHLLKGLPSFDPSKPDPFDQVQIPVTPAIGVAEKPAGS